MLKSLQFSRPKGPGFGISAEFYLSILSSKSVLPTMLEIINPAAVEGAVEGFGAPLMSGVDKSALSQPLERGNYALATKDRKTVLRMRVLSKEEAGFDPEVFVRSSRAIGASPELSNRMLATWQLLQLTFESHDAMVYPACQFMLDIAERIGALCEGVIADPVSGRYLLPDQVRNRPPVDARMDARDFVAIHSRAAESAILIYTAGMRKFSLPEFEIKDLDEAQLASASALLYSICQARLLGNSMKAGMKIGAKRAPFELSAGGKDIAMWEGIPVMTLTPPAGSTASSAIEAWSSEAS